MISVRPLVFIMALLAALPALAQERGDFEVVLLPLSGVRDAPGALGSIWRTEFTLVARGGEVVLAQTAACLGCAPTIFISPGFPFEAQTGGLPGEPPGALLYLSRATSMNAWFELRVRDMSRASDDWGTELPVVREMDLFTSELLLVNVPVDQRFRHALRIYDIDDRIDAVFRVSVVDEKGQVIAERDLNARPTPVAVSSFPRGPAVVELTDLRTSFPEIASLDHVNIAVAPVVSPTRFWAFVSLTNNFTQHVTVITPQRGGHE